MAATRSTEEADRSAVRVPFCSLPDGVRSDLTNGYRQGRSPDVYAIAREALSSAPMKTGQPPAFWPQPERLRAPLVLWGHGVETMALPDGTTMDDVAPTLAQVLSLERPHPEVRSGEPLQGVATAGTSAPNLVVLVGWRQTDSARSALIAEKIAIGAGSPAATFGSLPADPAAVFATLGTGGLPFQHGITGALVRSPDGGVVEAFDDGAPPSIIAALGDDLDESSEGKAEVALVGSTPSDRGLVGANWYLGEDDDTVRIVEGDMSTQVDTAIRLLDGGLGADQTPDLLGLALTGTAEELDAALPALEDAARDATDGEVTFALAGVPVASEEKGVSTVMEEALRRSEVPRNAVQAVGVGGFFIDQEGLGGASIEPFVAALRRVPGRSSGTVLADAFASTTITFEEYC